jgi:hypothetical protein
MSGVAALAFSHDAARGLVALLVGAGDDGGIDAEREAVLLETANVIMNDVMGSVCNLAEQSVDFDLPRYSEGELDTVFFQHGLAASAVLVDLVLSIRQHTIEGRLAVLLEAEAFHRMWHGHGAVDRAAP